jgi:cell division protein FtsA
MYSTCIGLILKGYSDYEHNYKEFSEKYKEVKVPKILTNSLHAVTPATPAPEPMVDVVKRKEKFWDKFKNNLIDMFKEEEDQIIK